MKKLLILILLIGSLPSISKSQVSIDSAFGGQLEARVYWKDVISANDSVRIYLRYSFNSNFTPAFSNLIMDYVNTDSTPDTLSLSDTLSIIVPGSYYLQAYEISLITGDTTFSVAIPVSVTPIVVVPSISFPQVGFPSIDGGQQIYNYDAGFGACDVDVWVSPGDTNFNFPFMVQTLQLTGSGQNTFTFAGYPSGYYFSYKFVIKNSAGSDTTGKGWILTSPSGGNPWISNLDSSNVTVNSILTYFKLVTNGTNCNTKTYIALSGNPNVPIDSVIQSFTGQGGINIVSSSFVGLDDATSYVVWTCVYSAGFSMCSQQSTIITLQAPAPLSVLITGTQTVPNTVIQRFEVTDTSETSGMLWLEIANTSDPNFSLPIYAGGNTSFISGVYNFTLDVSILSSGFGFVPNTTYLARVKAFNTTQPFPEEDVSPVIQFTFLPTFTGISELPEFSNIFVSNDELVVGDFYVGGLQMFDMSGRLVGNFEKIGLGEARFSLYSFETGVYVLQGVGVRPFKFLVQKF